MKNFILLFIPLCIAACSQPEPIRIKIQPDVLVPKNEYQEPNAIPINSSPKNQIPNYPFDTLMSDDFKLGISHEYDEDLDELLLNIHLYEKEKKIAWISGGSAKMPAKNHGYLTADFGTHFLFTQSHGGGNPHHCQVIQKATGKNHFEDGFFPTVVYLGHDEKEKLFLYLDTEDYDYPKLLDLEQKLNTIKLPKPKAEEIPCPGMHNCIGLDSVNCETVRVFMQMNEETNFYEVDRQTGTVRMLKL